MGTDKRMRQKENRRLRRDTIDRMKKRRRIRRIVTRVGALVIVVVGVVSVAVMGALGGNTIGTADALVRQQAIGRVAVALEPPERREPQRRMVAIAVHEQDRRRQRLRARQDGDRQRHCAGGEEEAASGRFHWAEG